MLEMPDAAPICSAGTALVATDEHGPFDIDIPIAAARNGITNAEYAHDDLTAISMANPAAVIAKPSAMTLRVPNFAAHFGTSGADTTSPIVAGSVASPASRGLIPSTDGSWKYRLTTNIRPLMVPAPIRMPSVAPMSRRLRISSRSTSGAGDRRSTMMNAITEPMETARHSRIRPEVHPHSDPLVTAKISGARMVATRTVPNQSIERGRVGSRDSSIARSVTGMQAAAIAASIQNRPCHPVESTSSPPTSGPAAAPTADAAPHSDTARSRSDPDDATVSKLSPEARMVEPAAPWIIRPPMMPI